jgi:hypothetical protein
MHGCMSIVKAREIRKWPAASSNTHQTAILAVAFLSVNIAGELVHTYIIIYKFELYVNLPFD